ncbi:MAG TPA: hypothetical protein VFV50_01880, partial [Bdellovibrionales bacterium]|nr:hypothetical protein [Bdellovibrionales bacterium]
DSPETLRHYARGMELRTAFRWTLLTGAADTVLKLKTQTLGDGEVNSQNVFLFDQRGRLRARLNVSSPDFFIELAGALEKLAIPVQRVAARAKRPERI